MMQKYRGDGCFPAYIVMVKGQKRLFPSLHRERKRQGCFPAYNCTSGKRGGQSKPTSWVEHETFAFPCSTAYKCDALPLCYAGKNRYRSRKINNS